VVASHVHITVFGFEFTLFEYQTASESKAAKRRSNPIRRQARRSSEPKSSSAEALATQHHTEAHPVTRARPHELVDVVEQRPCLTSGSGPSASESTSWPDCTVSLPRKSLTSAAWSAFARPYSDRLPPQGALEPPVPPPRFGASFFNS
jgi:hypothetical protein